MVDWEKVASLLSNSFGEPYLLWLATMENVRTLAESHGRWEALCDKEKNGCS